MIVTSSFANVFLVDLRLLVFQANDRACRTTVGVASKERRANYGGVAGSLLLFGG